MNGVGPGVGVLFVERGRDRGSGGGPRRPVRQSYLLFGLPVHRAQRGHALEFHVPVVPVPVLVVVPGGVLKSEVLRSRLELQAQRGDREPFAANVLREGAPQKRRIGLRTNYILVLGSCYNNR